jgi:transcriptional regulator with XRE-family HTH domain
MARTRERSPGKLTPEGAFGTTLRAVRQGRKLSQEELGFASGYHRTYISLLERGQKSPSLNTIFKLAAALKILPSDMVRDVEFRMRGTKLKGASKQ